MKCKRMLFLMIGIVSFSCMAFVGPLCTAQHASISITNVDVQLKETRPPIGGKTIHVYTIIVLLRNNGDVASDDITVKFYDPEYNATTTPPMKLTPLNASLQPGESKTYVMEDWPTPLSGAVSLNISFGPSSLDILPNSDNSGYYLYTLQIGSSKKTSTPGFEIALILVAIGILFLSRKIKK